MPTVLRQNGFEFVIRTRDHDPPHVHVFHGGTEVLINIGLNGNFPTLRRIENMSARNMRRALEITAENNEEFLAHWQRIYG